MFNFISSCQTTHGTQRQHKNFFLYWNCIMGWMPSKRYSRRVGWTQNWSLIWQWNISGIWVTKTREGGSGQESNYRSNYRPLPSWLSRFKLYARLPKTKMILSNSIKTSDFLASYVCDQTQALTFGGRHNLHSYKTMLICFLLPNNRVTARRAGTQHTHIWQWYTLVLLHYILYW